MDIQNPEYWLKLQNTDSKRTNLDLKSQILIQKGTYPNSKFIIPTNSKMETFIHI